MTDRLDPRVIRPTENRFTPGTAAPDAPSPDLATPRIAQRPVVRRVLPASALAEFDAAQESPDIAASITPAQAADGRVLAAALTKAFLARAEPGRYRVADEEDDVERVVVQALARNVDDRVVARLQAPLARALREPRKVRLLTADRDEAALRVARPLPRIRLAGATDGTAPRVVVPDADRARRRAGSANRPTFGRVLVELRTVHCRRITAPRDNPDDMVLGTVLVGASGNVAAGRSEDLGEFRSGDLVDFGDVPLGQFSLKSTPGYPKHFYVLFKLCEVDSDGKEIAADLTKSLGGLAATLASAVAGPLVGAGVGTMISAISSFFMGLIDEDEFRIHGKRLTLDDMYDLADGRSEGPRERTGDIAGHGGIYRIGYRWLMGA